MNTPDRILAVLALATLLLAGPALADVTWDGTTDTDLEEDGNYVGGSAPANDTTTDVVQFSGGATANQPVMTEDRSVAGIAFSGGGDEWSIFDSGTGPFTLTLGSYGVRALDGTAGDTNTVGANATLSISGTTTFRDHDEALIINAKITGSGNAEFEGTIGNNNQQSIRLYGDNDYTGTTTILDDGYVHAHHANAFGTAANTIVVYGSGGNDFRDHAELTVHAATGLNANKSVQLGHDNGTPGVYTDDVGDGNLSIGAGVTFANDITLYGTPNTWGAGSGNLAAVNDSGARYVTGTITVMEGATLRVARYGNANPTMYLNRDSGGTVIGKITGDGDVHYVYSGSSYNRVVYVYGDNDYTGGTTIGIAYGCDEDVRIFSDTAFGTGAVQLLGSYSTYDHILVGDNLTMDNDFRGGPAGRIKTNAFLLTLTGVIRPGDTGLDPNSPVEGIDTFTVEDLKLGSDSDGVNYVWNYDETTGDLIATTTLQIGSATNVLDVVWLGAGEAQTSDHILATWSGGTDPDENAMSWTVNAPEGITGSVWVDEDNNQLMLTLAPVPEPSTIALLLLGGGALGAARRRR